MKNKLISVLFILFIYQFVFGQTGKFSSEKVDELNAKLDSICLPIKNAGITISCKVMHADFKKILYELDPETGMIPASITKLITAGPASFQLGGAYPMP